ncbi:MAG: STM4011 family radical SAM protein [Paracoccaceae bacterium]
MTDPITILWRGSLSSCNYACGYCPFAKTKDSRATLDLDRASLDRFCDWVALQNREVSVLFTPWGEALIRDYYRKAIARLSHLPHVSTVAIQTNFSCNTRWLDDCDLDTAAFWVTYHPTEITQDTFVRKIHTLESRGVRYSVGVVGDPKTLDEIEQLKSALPAETYLWVNAMTGRAIRYSAEQITRLTKIDPLFSLNHRPHRSKNRPCFAGETVISVEAGGTATRCHFIKTPIGNIYDAGFEQALKPRNCSASYCRCHIGYSHLKDLELRDLFGNGFLERRAPVDVTLPELLRR